MCTFEDDRTVLVCDVAIRGVRAELDQQFPGEVDYIHIEGRPTRVIAPSTVESDAFRLSAERAIAKAQASEG